MEQMNSMSSKFTLISLNVGGIRDEVKRKKIFEWCKSKKKSDIVFLQETYSTVEVEERWKSEWEGSMFLSHGSNHSRGVSVLISSELAMKIDDILIDENGRFIFY